MIIFVSEYGKALNCVEMYREENGISDDERMCCFFREEY